MRYLISGGGTGGHIFPAVSIANALKELDPEAEILFVGALGRMEMERVPQAGYQIVGLPVRGFNRSQPWKNVSVLMDLAKSIRMVKKIIRDFRPDVGVGVGGYASGAAMWAAAQIWQNAVSLPVNPCFSPCQHESFPLFPLISFLMIPQSRFRFSVKQSVALHSQFGNPLLFSN